MSGPLLSLVYSEEGGERTYVRLHKVVHAALKRGEIANLKSCERDHTVAEAIKIFKSQLQENYKKYAFCKNLMPHCESLLKHMTSEFSSDQNSLLERLAPFVDFDTVIDWLNTLAGVCQQSSYFSFAKLVAYLAYDLLQNLDDTSTGAIARKGKVLNIRGPVYNSLGQYNQAKELHEKALTIRKTIFGEDHADVATSYNNLASVYNRLGQYNQAKGLYEKALTIRKQTIRSELALVNKDLVSSGAEDRHEKACCLIL